MIRIVATDMDETFLAHDHSIPQANIDACLKMREAGVLFVPASGRGYSSVMHSLESMPEACLADSYVISYNGGCINRVGDDTPIISSTLPFETIRSIFEWSKDKNVGIHLYELGGTIWGYNIIEEEYEYLKGHMELTPLPGDSIDFLRDVPLSKILYVYPDLDYLHKLADDMPKELYPGTDTTFSSGRYFEFNPQGVNKGSGLKALADILSVDIADVIACGDSTNDLDMIVAAGIGVAVANSTQDVLDAADYLATSTCNDGIFKEVYEHFIENAQA